MDPSNLKQDSLPIKLLPSSLNETIPCLEKDKVILEAMGANLSKAYIAVKKAEEEFFKNLKFEEEVKILLERY